MNAVGQGTPLRPLVHALQHPWFTGSWDLASLGVLVGIGVASLLLAGWRLRRE